MGKTNKETGQVEKINDMDYEDYMNIINRVRKTKELTRVRTEQARLASMYAQEAKRQEEISLEEERLKKERERLEEERKNPNFQQPIITMAKSQESLEKGQLDNIEQEQSVKVSPRDSPPPRAPTTQIEQEQSRMSRSSSRRSVRHRSMPSRRSWKSCARSR